MTATLTAALDDFRKLAQTLVAAEIARRAALLAEARRIAEEVAAEQRKTREAIAAMQEGSAAELAAILAETAELSGQKKDEEPQPKPAEAAAPKPEPSGEKKLEAPAAPEQPAPVELPDSVVITDDPEADLPDSVAAEVNRWRNDTHDPEPPAQEVTAAACGPTPAANGRKRKR